MIVLKIGNIETDIIGHLSTEDYKALEKKLSFRPAGYQYTPAFNEFFCDSEGKKVRRKWDGWKRQCWRNKKRTYFPTGLMSLAIEVFQERKIEFKRQDLRIIPEKNLFLELDPCLEMRDYQAASVDSCVQRTRGILQAATGAGKTAMAARLIQQLGVAPFLFFVTSTDLLEQAKDSLEAFLLENGQHIKVGQIGGGIIDIRDINVLTIQTTVRALGKAWDSKTKFDNEDTDDPTPIEEHREEIINLLKETKGSICDEVQHWRAETCQDVNKALPNCYFTYGLSATPYRDEGDDMMIQSCFGRKIGEITASKLIRDGWLIKPNIKMVHIKQERSPLKHYQSIYKDYVVENKYYNGVIANIANAFIKQNRLVLILVNHIPHGQNLAAMIPGARFLSGSSPKDRRKDSLNALRRKEISCIVSTSIFDEGIDVKPLDTVILAGQGKSKVRAMQRIGRILRPYEDEWGKKTKATAIDFVIHQKHLEKHGQEREAMYHSEEEYVIEHLNG